MPRKPKTVFTPKKAAPKPTSSTRSASAKSASAKSAPAPTGDKPREKKRHRDLPVAPVKPNRAARRLALQDPTKRDNTTTSNTASDMLKSDAMENETVAPTTPPKPSRAANAPLEKTATKRAKTPTKTPTINDEFEAFLNANPKIAEADAPAKIAKANIETPMTQTSIAQASIAETPTAETPTAKKPRKTAAKDETVAKDKATKVVSETDDDTPAFDELGLDETITRAISALGFETPTPIQARAIPLLLQGRDIIGQAQTGTGKTAAFALPIIQKLDHSKRETQALILAPTRELAIQVAGGVFDLAKHTGLRVVPVYGGQPIDRQFRALQQGAHIVVGTPGRVLDHLRRGSLSLENVSFCTLDEADEMLALGFLEDMETILAMLPENRQLAFFSATMPPRIAALARRFLNNAEHVAIDTKRRTVDAIEQTYYEVPRGKKLEALGRVLDMETPGPTIVFCHTRQETNELAEALRLRGYSAESLNGEMSQADRERTLRRFRDGQADLLVATDVAARGLDIDSVTHVINFNLPWDVEQYIHRIGRTGRAGRKGDAITLVEARERRKLKFIEQMTGAKIKPARIPSGADIATRRRENFAQGLRTALENAAYEAQVPIVEELSEEFDSSEIAAAALQMLWQLQHSASDDSGEELSGGTAQPEGGMTRLQLGLGRSDGLRVGELVGLIANKCGISGRAIGTIDILDRATFLEVPSGEVENVLDVLRNTPFKGRKPRADLAKTV